MKTISSIADYADAVRATGQNVPSPCISVCRMDAASGWCEGCHRTLDEIAQWSRMSDSDKRAVWARIEQRAAQMQRTTAASP